MPAFTAPPNTKGAAEEVQAATQEAVVEAVVQPTNRVKTIVGTMQAAAQTNLGAIGTTTTVTGTSLGIGNFADLQELTPSAYAAMFLYQGIKHWHRVNQDHHKWWILPFVAGIAAFAIVYFTSRGDLWESASHCVRTCWMAGYQAMLQYHTSKPLGIFSSAADITPTPALEVVAHEPAGVS